MSLEQQLIERLQQLSPSYLEVVNESLVMAVISRKEHHF